MWNLFKVYNKDTKTAETFTGINIHGFALFYPFCKGLCPWHFSKLFIRKSLCPQNVTWIQNLQNLFSENFKNQSSTKIYVNKILRNFSNFLFIKWRSTRKLQQTFLIETVLSTHGDIILCRSNICNETFAPQQAGGFIIKHYFRISDFAAYI